MSKMTRHDLKKHDVEVRQMERLSKIYNQDNKQAWQDIRDDIFITKCKIACALGKDEQFKLNLIFSKDKEAYSE